MNNFKLKSLFVISILLIPYTTSLDCYQCSSSDNIECSEIFNIDNTKLKPTPCDDVYEAQYCVKTTGIYSGSVGTQRLCSSKKFESYCSYIQREGDTKPLRSCVFSCRSDGCNNTSKLQSNFLNFIVLFSACFLLGRLSTDS